jgi:hypothetical protein
LVEFYLPQPNGSRPEGKYSDDRLMTAWATGQPITFFATDGYACGWYEVQSLEFIKP